MKYTFEEAIASFKQRSPMGQQMLRRIAARRIVDKGAEEVGTSDINHELVHMCNEYGGDWDQIYLDALEEYSSL